MAATVPATVNKPWPKLFEEMNSCLWTTVRKLIYGYIQNNSLFTRSVIFYAKSQTLYLYLTILNLLVSRRNSGLWCNWCSYLERSEGSLLAFHSYFCHFKNLNNGENDVPGRNLQICLCWKFDEKNCFIL